MNKKDKREVEILEKAKKLIEKGWGRGHVKKHSFDFDMHCGECQAQIVVAWLENAIAHIKFFSKKK